MTPPSNPERPWRLFLAITPPAAVRESAQRIQHAFQKDLPPHDWRWVPRDNLHLTLLFFGAVAPAVVPALTQKLASICRGHPALSLTAASVGAFPTTRRPRVLWMGLTGDLEPLSNLYQHLRRDLADYLERPPADRYTPHLTLARAKDRSPARDVTRSAAALASHVAGQWQAHSVDLMRSHLGTGGSVYEVVCSAQLGSNFP